MPSLAPFGQAVSEEKIFLTLANQKKRIILGGHINRPNGTKWRNFIEDLTEFELNPQHQW
jgi:heme oxygenase